MPKDAAQLEEKRRKDREYYHANRDKRREQSRASYLNNRDAELARASKRYRENPQKFIDAAIAWRKREGNRDRVKDHNSRYAKRNRARVTSYHREWRKRNPEKAAIIYATRRAKKMLALPLMNEDQVAIIKVMYECRQRISKCCGIMFHVDHIVPLARGGMHVPSNLQLLTATMNCRKHVKLPMEQIRVAGV